MWDRIARTLSKLAINRSWTVLGGAALLAVAAVLAATKLTFDPDLLNLIPRNNRQVNDFKHVLLEMGTIDQHIVVVQLPAGADPGEFSPLIEDLASSYEALPEVAGIEYKIPNPVDLIGAILPRAMLLLTPEQLELVGEKLTDRGIHDSIARNAALLQTPQGMAVKPLVQYDPFNLLPVFLNKFKAAGGGLKIDLNSGYYMSSDHTMVLLLVKPKRPAQDLPFAQRLVAGAERIEAAALKKFHREYPASAMPRVGHTGTYSVALEDAELIKKDVVANVVFSVVGVLLLFLYAFRRPASLAYAGVPMGLAILITAGLAALVLHRLSFSSTTFAALIAGLGVDFITVLYARYVDERNRGASMEDGLFSMLRRTLPGVSAAAVTTAATFYAYMACDFRGMSELGFLTATGIVIFFFCVIFLLPALIVVTERGRAHPPRLFLHSFGSNRLIDLTLRNRKKVLLFWGVALVLCAISATRIRFSDNVENLRSKGNKAAALQSAVTTKFGQSFSFMMFAVEGPDLDTALTRTYSALPRLDDLVSRKVIGSYQSIATFLPPRSQQLKTIERLRADPRFDSQRIHASFVAALTENGFRPEAYDEFWPLFERALRPEEPVTLDTIGDPTLHSLLERFVKKGASGGTMSVTYLSPPDGDWGRELSPELMTLSDTGIVTGVNVVTTVLRQIVRRDAIRSTLLGFAGVFILFTILFRSLKQALLVFVPFVAGAIGMLGLMALFGLEFNFINVYVGLFLVGVATDYAIYMMNRYREDPATFAVNAGGTGKAVLMAALTSILGFGSFAISHYPGLRSIGYASTFGLVISCLAALTLLPALLAGDRK